MNIFGVEVKKFLLENNLKQNDIAERAKITKANVSQLLNYKNISLDKMLLIANSLDCKLKITLEPNSNSNDVNSKK